MTARGIDLLRSLGVRRRKRSDSIRGLFVIVSRRHKQRSVAIFFHRRLRRNITEVIQPRREHRDRSYVWMIGRIDDSQAAAVGRSYYADAFWVHIRLF